MLRQEDGLEIYSRCQACFFKDCSGGPADKAALNKKGIIRRQQMRKDVFRAITGLYPVLFLLLVLAACPNPSGGDTNSGTIVTALSLDCKVTAPVRDAQPDTRAINETQYTGTVAWQTGDGAAHTGSFAASTVYRVVVTLTPKTGYTFTGVAANSFTYTGATAVNNAGDSGVVTIIFPSTAAGPGQDTVVNAFSLDGKVTAPVRDTQPDTKAINETQYTGTVAWQTGDGAAHTGLFAPSTVYRAVVTLTPKTGYTFTGVGANSFTFSGATVANAADSGTVTITFPATAAPGQDTVVNALSLDGKITAPVRGGTPDTAAINETQYTGTVAWQTGDGASHTGPFAPSTVYRAVLTLTPKTDFTFTGVGLNSFTYTGATVTNAANSGTVTITFPATAAPDTEAAAGNAAITINFEGPVEDIAITHDPYYDPSIPVLQNETWYDDSDPVKYHQFYAQAGISYAINWNDSYQGDGTKSADVGVSTYWKATDDSIFGRTDSGWSSPQTFTADRSGIVVLKVEYYSGGSTTGTYAVKYTASENAGGSTSTDIADVGATLTLSVANAGSYSNFRWILDGTERSETTGSITIDTTVLDIGLHRITVIAVKAGISYSREIKFQVNG
jgi:hypothetical protein